MGGLHLRIFSCKVPYTLKIEPPFSLDQVASLARPDDATKRVKSVDQFIFLREVGSLIGSILIHFVEG